jgi:hypothetical protein
MVRCEQLVMGPGLTVAGIGYNAAQNSGEQGESRRRREQTVASRSNCVHKPSGRSRGGHHPGGMAARVNPRPRLSDGGAIPFGMSSCS